MIKFLIFLAVSLSFVAATPVNFYTDCGSKAGKITTIDVQDCTANPCILKRGGKVELKLDFVATKDSSSLTTKVYGLIGGIKIPWGGLPANACSSTNCPLKAGTSYQYKNAISVLSSYPAIKVMVQFEFRSDKGENVMCFQIPVQLK